MGNSQERSTRSAIGPLPFPLSLPRLLPASPQLIGRERTLRLGVLEEVLPLVRVLGLFRHDE